MDIRMKSTGMLIDEWITAGFKYNKDASAENRIRVSQLEKSFEIPADNEELHELIKKLQDVLKSCWNAQEILFRAHKNRRNYSCTDITEAAFKAQAMNAKRNKLIRRIDELLGELELAPLEKTYSTGKDI